MPDLCLLRVGKTRSKISADADHAAGVTEQ